MQKRLPQSAGDALATYLGVTDPRYLLLIHRIVSADNVHDVRDVLVANGIPLAAEEAVEDEVQGPTNDMYTATQPQVQLEAQLPTHIRETSSQPSTETTALPASTEADTGNVYDGKNGRISRRGGRDARTMQTPLPSSRRRASTNMVKHSNCSEHQLNGRRPSHPISEHSSQTHRWRFSGYPSCRYRTEPGPQEWPGRRIPCIQGVARCAWNRVLQGQLDERASTPCLSTLKEWRPKDDTTFYADFTFVDEYGNLTEWLRGQGVIDDEFDVGLRPIRYHIEVKSTARHEKELYHMSDW